MWRLCQYSDKPGQVRSRDRSCRSRITGFRFGSQVERLLCLIHSADPAKRTSVVILADRRLAKTLWTMNPIELCSLNRLSDGSGRHAERSIPIVPRAWSRKLSRVYRLLAVVAGSGAELTGLKLPSARSTGCLTRFPCAKLLGVLDRRLQLMCSVCVVAWQLRLTCQS